MKKILVTGATGFVGSHFCDYLIDNKISNKIFVTKRYHLSKLDNLLHIKNKINFLDCDITDPVSVNNLIKNIKPDIIFHFAAESFVSPSWLHPNRYMSVNYNGTLNLLEAIKNFSIKTKILIPGSGEEYGELSKNEMPITVNTTLKPVNPYAVSKIAQDLISYVYHKSYNLNVYRCRTFNHEGPRREKVFGISWYAYQIARIERGLQPPIIKTGDTEDLRNFTHVKDICDAYWKCVLKCKKGELYLVGTESKKNIHTFKQSIKKLIKMSAIKNVKIVQVAEFTRPTKVPFLLADVSKFEKVTKWKPKISFDEILLSTINYWRQKLDENPLV
jgi:GDP-4-dehydro-6-deoxy-D-mannose reductase